MALKFEDKKLYNNDTLEFNKKLLNYLFYVRILNECIIVTISHIFFYYVYYVNFKFNINKKLFYLSKQLNFKYNLK